MNLGSLEWTEADMERVYSSSWKTDHVKTVNRILAEKLEKHGVKLSLRYEELSAPQWMTTLDTFYRRTHTAFLVCIEPIERDSQDKLIKDLAALFTETCPKDGNSDKDVWKLVERARKLVEK